MPAPNVGCRQAVHEGRQVTIPVRPQHEVPVLGHDAIGQDTHGHLFGGSNEYAFESAVILGLLKDDAPTIGAVEHVEDKVGGSAAGDAGDSDFAVWEKGSV